MVRLALSRWDWLAGGSAAMMQTPTTVNIASTPNTLARDFRKNMAFPSIVDLGSVRQNLVKRNAAGIVCS